jgi:hypothetical protein
MKQRGQALTEYVVVATALGIALFAPWPDGTSSAQRLADAVVRLHRNYAFFLSIG